MKIKKIFGLASICSLAVLMTACGNSTKNDGSYDSEIYKEVAISKEEYINKNKAKKEVVKVFENQKIYSRNENYGIVVTYDDDKYYVYNLNIKEDNKKILEFTKSEINGITISSGSYYLLVKYLQNDDSQYGYAIHTFDGKVILEKTYLNSTPSIQLQSNSELMLGLYDSLYYKKFKVSYNTMDGEKQVYNQKIYYAASKKYELSREVVYYTEEEFDSLYSKKSDVKYDASVFGLKGYSIQLLGDSMYIYKKDKLVNIFNSEGGVIMSDGCFLNQVTKEVGDKDKYDLFYDGKYLQVKTYKYSLVDSKMTELKNFHYYIADYGDGVLTYDEEGNVKEIIGATCSVLDFKEKKTLFATDLKGALIKGNGQIEISKHLVPSFGNVIEDNDTFYCYGNTTTTVNDKNGKVVEIYDGIYYDGITVVAGAKNTTNFIDKTGKILLSLKDAESVNRFKYIGYDLYGKKLVVVIEYGVIKTAEIGSYFISIDKAFLTKTDDDNVVTFYSYDDELTPINYQFDSDDVEFEDYKTYEGIKYYVSEDKTENTYTLLYFK